MPANEDLEVDFEFECDRKTGFMMHPGENKRFGYVCALNGFGLSDPLAQDITVFVPFNTGSAPNYSCLKWVAPNSASPVSRAAVVGIIEKFSWRGGVCDPITIEFYISQQNALQIKMIQQASLTDTSVSSLAFWIAAFDQELKEWFEQAFPISSGGVISGHLNGRDIPVLSADMKPIQATEGVDVNVYKAKIEIVPEGANTYQLSFASSSQQNLVRNWGILIGS